MKDETAETLSQIKKVMAQYDQRLTIRQIYYRLVADFGLRNHINSYKRIGKILGDARLRGEIPFSAIEDRTREISPYDSTDFETVGQFMTKWYDRLDELELYYSVPKWYGQPERVVMMVEKQALQGIFSDVCQRWQVDLMVCKGYPSLTQQYELAERMVDRIEEDQNLNIIYFGDFDPSGENIPDKMQERLYQDFNMSFTSFTKEALTMEQVDAWGLPPAPAKTTDTRTQGFIEKYGVGMQVELDAIKPNQLSKMINDSIARHYDTSIGAMRDNIVRNNRKRIKEFVAEMEIPALRGLIEDDE